jgi:hypothetical protein
MSISEVLSSKRDNKSNIPDISGYYTGIKTVLRNLKLKSQQLRYTGALMLWIASLSILMIGWFILGGMLKLPVEIRIPAIILWVGAAIWAAYFFILKTIIKKMSIESIAFRIEQCYPENQDQIGRAHV